MMWTIMITPIGIPQIRALSLMLVQGLVLNMTSIEERFRSWGHIRYYDSEPGSLTPHTEKMDDIDARLATLDQKLMVHSLRILTLKNAEVIIRRWKGAS